ncbi:DUF11 domain-containing protein [Candidatus Nomurabacteria bacterium]|nr:DUF11 domain-containing protein [Candidatus Nomurabacteria bacterium]
MTNIIKISIFTGAIAVAFGVFAFIPAVHDLVEDSVFTPIFAFAYDSGDSGTGCSGCGGSSSGSSDSGGNTSCISGPCAPTPPNPPQYQTPSCDSFTANGQSGTLTIQGAADVTLAWQTSNASAVSINQGIGSVPVDGSKTVNVASTKTFTLTASASNLLGALLDLKDTCTVKVIVEPQAPAPSCDSFTASPSNLPYGGGNVTLTWETTNATNVSINQGIGAVTADGSTSVNVTGTKTFTLTASNTQGSDTCTAPVTVAGQSTDPAISIIKRDASDKDDNQTVAKGGTAHFEIVVTNTGSENLKNVVVTDPVEPNCDRTIGNLAVGASQTYTCNSTNVQNDFTNVANVTGQSVVDNQSVSDSDPTYVDVTTSNNPVSCDSFTVSRTSVSKGTDVTLTWRTTGASSVSISNVGGSFAGDGSTVVNVDKDTTYVLTASNGNDSDSCQVSVDVESGGGGGGTPTPRCDLDVSDDKVAAGTKVTLSWDTSNTKEITLKDNHGNKIFSSDDKDYMDGEIDVIVNEDTTFTLTAERGSKDRDCKVEVEVTDPKVTVYTKRDQPLVAGIALTQVPYTGFEAGPALTAMFYILLTLWALYIAYVLIIRRDSVFGFSLPQPVDQVAVAQNEEFKKKVAMLAAKHSHQPWNPQM